MTVKKKAASEQSKEQYTHIEALRVWLEEHRWIIMGGRKASTEQIMWAISPAGLGWRFRCDAAGRLLGWTTDMRVETWSETE
jgi:YD repeat-containing protein